MNFVYRTERLCAQLLRFGGVSNETLMRALEAMADVSEDLSAQMPREGVPAQIREAQRLLDTLLKELS